MKFIIDREIYFRPADGAIWHVNTESEKRFLTPASSRLFVYLIEQQGQVLSRNDIFQAVWEIYGLHSSNNTLNQYISLLRRSLADFGLDAHLIKTVPKAGFLLSADVMITREGAALSPARKRERSRKIKKLLLALLAVVFILLTVWLWRLPLSGESFTLRDNLRGNVTACHVQPVGPGSGADGAQTPPGCAGTA